MKTRYLRVVLRKKQIQAATRPLHASRFASDIFVTKLKNRTSFPIGTTTRTRGVVKPRCMYSFAALTHMDSPPHHSTDNDTTSELPATYEVHQCMVMAKDRLNDAMKSSICIYGMATLDPNDSCYNIFICLRPITRLRLVLGAGVLRVQDHVTTFEAMISLRRRIWFPCRFEPFTQGVWWTMPFDDPDLQTMLRQRLQHYSSRVASECKG